MKRLLVLLSLFAGMNLYGQMRIQFDAGLGAALSLEDMKAGGISAMVEPKLFITNNIAAGIRLEGDVLFGGTITQSTEDFSVGMSSRAAQCLKGEYYFSDRKIRPFVGLALGRFTQANIGASSTGEVNLEASSSFGVAPEVGIALGSFRLSALYNIVTDKDIVSITSGDLEISKNYMVIQMSWKIFKIGF